VHPEEFSLLFNTILINVTSFFRDAPAWNALARDQLPALLERKGDDEPVRVWCAACATGDEAYTAAILLAEALGEKQYAERVKIYGTDIDEDALSVARQAVYSPKQVEPIDPALRERYFERTDHRFTFRPDLRRTVIFGRNDLMQDAPISRVDLLVCRNALIYFTAESQARILDRLHFALSATGMLFVGKSEMLIRHSGLFEPADLKQRLFRKVARETVRDRYAFVAELPEDGNGGELPQAVRDAALDVSPVAQIVVDIEGRMVFANQHARTLFRLRPKDRGRQLHDLEVSYRPADLRSSLEQAYADRRQVMLAKVDFSPPAGEQKTLDIHITPVIANRQTLGASITFADVSVQRRLGDELERSRRELEVAYEELQSTIEELETTNEELQSTNEELETMNEELQSVNEELETTNEELRSRTREVDQVNGFLDGVLTNLGVGVAVLDVDQCVQIWNAQAQDLWGVTGAEARNTHVLGLDIGLPVERLKQPLRAVLGGDEPHVELELEAINRRGRPILCRITVMPLMVRDSDIAGAVLLMEGVEPS
jgi:two-component system CheB/CheR fusion protein